MKRSIKDGKTEKMFLKRESVREKALDKKSGTLYNEMCKVLVKYHPNTKFT